MSKATIYIPSDCKVGWNKRNECYTGKLAFVIYKKNNEWKQVKSWEGWIENHANEIAQQKCIEKYNKDVDVKIERGYTHNITKIYDFNQIPDDYRRNLVDDVSFIPKEFKNEPLEGWVLNKNGGGGRGWDGRSEFIRVFDPRGWEVEISIKNLLYILENANSIVGKALEGKFVYGWDGAKLVIVPEKAPEFASMQSFTKMQSNTLSTKDLAVGMKYVKKNLSEVTYMGKFHEYKTYNYDKKGFVSKGKKYFWWTGSYFETSSSLNSFSHSTDELDIEYANLFEKLEYSPMYSPYAPELYQYEKGEGNWVLHNGEFKELHYGSYNLRKDAKNAEQNYTKELENWNSKFEEYRRYGWNKPTLQKQELKFNGGWSDIQIPTNMNLYEYVHNVLGGTYKQIKFLKNGKEAK